MGDDETPGQHWHADVDCTVCGLVKRVAELEQKVDRLTRGIHLTLASVGPGLAWLDGAPEGGAS